MEEVLRAGSCIAGRQLSVGVVKRILVILLGVILIEDPIFKEMAERFVNAPLVPAAKTEDVAAIGGKAEEMIRKPDPAVMTDTNDLDLSNPVSENEAASDLLLAEIAVPDMTLELPHMSEETEKDLAETVLVKIISEADGTVESNQNIPENAGSITVDDTIAANIPEASITSEATIPKVDFTSVEKPIDNTVKPEVIAPTSDLTEMKKPTEGIVNSDARVSNPDLTVTDKPTYDIVNTEATVSEADITVTEKPTDDTANTEVTMLPTDITVTEKPTDDTVNTEVTVPATDITVTEKPTDDTVNTEVTTPVEDDFKGTEVIGSDPSGSKTEILDTPSDDPTIPEPIVPGTEIDASDVTDDNPSDIVDDNGSAEETVSCFLLDEAGMLYGFLPEYAEMPDGCLTLPEECTGIRSGAFAGCGAEVLELYIPAGAATIEEGALAGLDFLEWIEVDGGNPGCVSDSGVLFDSTMSVLLAFPSAWMDGYSVPPSVTRIAGRAFEGTAISMLDVRECGILSFGDNAFGSSAGNGIRIVVSEEGLSVYGEILAGYAVTLTR